MGKMDIYLARELNVYVRLDGSRHQIVSITKPLVRHLLECETGELKKIEHDDWIKLADEGHLTEDVNLEAREAIDKNLERPWDTFTIKEMVSALNRQPYLVAMDNLNPKPRPWERRTAPLIEDVIAKVQQEDPELPPMSVAAFRKWDTRWLQSGRDVRALADLDFKKGNRREEQDWIDLKIEEAIDELMLKSPHLNPRQVTRRLQSEIAVQAHDENLPLPPRTRADRSFGHFRVARIWAKRNYLEHQVASVGHKEARRRSQGVTMGPQPDLPLEEVESDHTLLDVMLVDECGNLIGRPWLTTIFDRYSRQILGYYITLDHPSWASLLQALLVTVRAKQPMLASFGYSFRNSLVCHGVPKKLFVDRGREFIGNELVAFGSLLGCKIIPLPRASGSNKGKVERNYGTVNNGFMSELRGRTGNRPDKKIRDEALPRLTLQDLDRLFVAWWVDVYQVTPIDEVGKPKLLYENKMVGTGYQRLPPPEELIGPIESPLQTRMLTPKGIRIDNFWYHSDDLRLLHHNLGADMLVIIRPDRRDGDVLHVFDSANRLFIQASLEGKYAGTHMPRANLIKQRKSDLRQDQSKDELLNEHRGKKAFYDEIDALNARHEQPARDLSLPHQKRTEFIERPIFNPKASEAPLGSHDESRDIEPNPYDSLGPYAAPSLSELAMDGKIKPQPIPGTGETKRPRGPTADTALPSSMMPDRPPLTPERPPPEADDDVQTW